MFFKFRLVGTWIKRREVTDGARRIISGKLREHQYREGDARCHENERVEWDGESNIKHMLAQVKRAMVESPREFVA